MELSALLDPEVVERMKALPVVVDEERYPTTTINGVEVDLRGDAMHETECADCREPLKVEIAPQGVDLDLLVSKPRIAVCEPCGKARVTGQRGTLVHRKKRVAKHQPRLTDGLDHPVEVKHTTEETNVTFDLSKYSAAQLAAHIEEANEVMRAKIEAAMPANVMAVLADRAEAEVLDKAQMEAEREQRKVVLPAFTIKGKEVPALDLSAVASLDDVASATERSPYNKALFAVGLPLLSKSSTDDMGTEAKHATYGELAHVHADLMAMAGGVTVAPVVAAHEPSAPALSDKAQALIDAAALLGKTLDPAKAEQMAGAL